MQITTLKEFEAGLGASFDSLRDPEIWDRYKTTFATSRNTVLLSALSRHLAEIVNSHAGSTLILYAGTGLVPNAENTYLLQVFRRAFGERRGVPEAPVHVFT